MDSTCQSLRTNYSSLFFFFVFFRNRAIADYLRSNGYEEAYSVFKKEAELDMVSVWEYPFNSSFLEPKTKQCCLISHRPCLINSERKCAECRDISGVWNK